MRNNKRILYIQYTNPAVYPPLVHSSHIFAEKNWKILFLGTGGFGINDLRFGPHQNIKIHRFPYCGARWLTAAHGFLFYVWAIIWALFWRPKWVIASDVYSCPIALVLSYFHIGIIYNEFDSPVFNKEKRNFFSAHRIFIMLSRTALTRRAKCCVLPNQERANVFKSDVSKQAKTVIAWNCPLRKDAVRKQKRAVDKKIYFLFCGSIGPSALPLSLFEAMKQLPEQACLSIVGYETVGTYGYINFLQNKINKLKLQKRIKFFGTIPTRDELLRHYQQAHIGLSLMPQKSNNINLRYMAGASNKAFDYLACGLPILVSNLPEWKKMYVTPGYALACDPDDVEDVTLKLRWFIEHSQEAKLMGEKGRKRILEEWNYETQFKPVLDLIDGVAYGK